MSGLQFDDPDQHPVHERQRPASPRGATLSHHNILNKRVLHRGGVPLQRGPTGCAFPVPFYHCFGMVLGNLACTTPRRRPS